MPNYDAASWDYLRRILLTFPGDMATRAYASAMQVLDLPFRQWGAPASPQLQLLYAARNAAAGWLHHSGPMWAAGFVLAVSWSSLRLGLFSMFLILYFAAYPAIQFSTRHYFHLEFLTLTMIACLADGVARRLRRGSATASPEADSSPSPAAGGIRRLAVCAFAALLTLALPLYALRWYQNGRVTSLLRSYAGASTSATGLTQVAPGHFRLRDRDPLPDSRIDATATLGHPSTRFIEVIVNPAACRPGTTLNFVYDARHPELDFSHAVPIQRAASGGGPMRLFEPVYTAFEGVDVADSSPACVERVSALTGLDRFPLLLPAQLTPGWQAQPQYQRIVALP